MLILSYGTMLLRELFSDSQNMTMKSRTWTFLMMIAYYSQQVHNLMVNASSGTLLPDSSYQAFKWYLKSTLKRQDAFVGAVS